MPGLPRWRSAAVPTVTELPTADAHHGRRDSASNGVTTPEIWEGNQWVRAPGAGSLEIPYYPRKFVDPKNGLVFRPASASSALVQRGRRDGHGRGSGQGTRRHIWKFNRDYGAAAVRAGEDPGRRRRGNAGAPPDASRARRPPRPRRSTSTPPRPLAERGLDGLRRRHLNATSARRPGARDRRHHRGGFVNIDPGWPRRPPRSGTRPRTSGPRWPPTA